MKICFISHVSNKLGASRSLLDIVEGLSKKGVECCVILRTKGPIEEELKKRGIEYSIIPFKSWISSNMLYKKIGSLFLKLIPDLLISFKILKKMKAWGADIVYTNSSIISVGAISAFFLRKPHIWHIREFGKEDYGFSFVLGEKLSMKLMEWGSFRIIVISEALKYKYVRYISPEKIERVYNPVELRGKVNKLQDFGQGIIKPKIFSLVIVGLLHPCKGQMDAILIY